MKKILPLLTVLIAVLLFASACRGNDLPDETASDTAVTETPADPADTEGDGTVETADLTETGSADTEPEEEPTAPALGDRLDLIAHTLTAGDGKITPQGAFTNVGTYADRHLTVLDKQTVFLSMRDIYPVAEKTHLEEMYKEFEQYPTSNFAAFRTIVQSTSSIIDCAKDFEAYANAKNDGYTYKYVDTYTLFDLIRQSGQGAQVSGE